MGSWGQRTEAHSHPGSAQVSVTVATSRSWAICENEHGSLEATRAFGPAVRCWGCLQGSGRRCRGTAFTWVQAHELAALLGVLAVLLAALWPLAQGGDTHLRFPAVACAAQAGVIAFGGEVEPFIHHVVLDVDTRLTCGEQI